ncbi:hypothetical protein [Aquimarina rubra]|uniref:Uncharacterized protein n=1 Tax=Aquimarina rubra TaxID=1920033 RepID=A0ABW5LL94_9FLAO
MPNNTKTYNNKLIASWFITLLLFLGIGGYTNYTQPVSYQESIELVVSEARSKTKTLSFAEAKYPKQRFDHSINLKLLSKHHSSISLIKNRELEKPFSLKIITHKTFLLRSNTYTTEEDPFHLG